jgi:PAS domain S-box-containing protein
VCHKNGSWFWHTSSGVPFRDKNGKVECFYGIARDITERKLAEIKLRESERLLNESQRISGIGSYVLDIISGTWSGSFYLNEMFEIEESDDHSLEGMVSMIHPEDQVMITSFFIKNVIGKKERFDQEFRFLTPKSKQIRWMHAVGELEFDLTGNPIKMFGTIRNITNRKLIEIELHDYERLLNESQRISGIGSYILDIVSRNWSGSLFLNELFGINESDDHSVEGWLSVIHPDDQAMMASYFTNEVLGEKGRFDKEYRIVAKKTKQERWVHGIGELEFDKDGSPVRMIGTIRDNTERKKVDEELRKLLRAVEQSPDSIIITNEKGDIEYANPAILKLTGYSNEELIGKNPRIFSSGEKTKKEYKILWDTIGSGNVWQGEFHNKKKNGELYWESATISPVLNDAGKITHYLAIREDISEQKKLNKELIEAKEHAEESDRLKASFLANMSHEIRTPMNSIMGFASLLPEEESKELMDLYAQIIVQNSEQLVSIIDGIVMYSKLQTRLFAFRPTIFDARKLLYDVQQSFNLPEYQNGVTLTVKISPASETIINSDYDKIRQVFSNLVTNAFKYTCKGEITIGYDINENLIEFFVKDTGIGIQEKEKKQIFERFYRGSNVDQSTIRGTGLGLSIVKELLELMGGKIWVESEVGKGSTFYFSIPE